jgi:hypothetical protein
MSTVSLNHLRVNESGTRLLHNIREEFSRDFSGQAGLTFALGVFGSFLWSVFRKLPQISAEYSVRETGGWK